MQKKTWMIVGSVVTVAAAGFAAYRVIKGKQQKQAKEEEMRVVTEDEFNRTMSEFGLRLSSAQQLEFAANYRKMSDTLSYIKNKDYLELVNVRLIEMLKWSNEYFRGPVDFFTRSMLVQESIDFHETIKDSREWLGELEYDEVRASALAINEIAIEVMYNDTSLKSRELEKEEEQEQQAECLEQAVAT